MIAPSALDIGQDMIRGRVVLAGRCAREPDDKTLACNPRTCDKAITEQCRLGKEAPGLGETRAGGARMSPAGCSRPASPQ